MNNFDKVLTKLDDKAGDIHEASEATKKRMVTLDRRYKEEAETEEVKKLTRTAEKVLEVEVNLNSENLAKLKKSLTTPETPNGFRDFLKNIAHKNNKKREEALRQMERILSLKPNSLSLSMSDKHSEQLIRTEILDHIVKQLLVGANIPELIPSYAYGTDTDLDAQLDAMSDQVIAMLEGFKESDPLKEVTPKEAAYNALYKSSDQRYFDKDPNDPTKGNKLKGGVITGFAERMANGRRVDYKTLHTDALNGETSIDLNTKELLILTGNGMLPFDAHTRSKFEFQYLVYLPELGGYAGLMENGCGDIGKEGNFVFINTEEIIKKKEEPVEVKEEEVIITPTEEVIVPIEVIAPLPVPEVISPVIETPAPKVLEHGYYDGSIKTTIKDLGLEDTAENKEIIERFYLAADKIVADTLINSPFAKNLRKAESTFATNSREITKELVDEVIKRIGQDKELLAKIEEGSISQEEALSEIFKKDIVKKDLDQIIKERNNRYDKDGNIKRKFKNGGKVIVPPPRAGTIGYRLKSLVACKAAAKAAK